jgi:hypothetical protein
MPTVVATVVRCGLAFPSVTAARVVGRRGRADVTARRGSSVAVP